MAISERGQERTPVGYKVLEPQDSVWKHAWLFANPWVEESWDEIEDDVDPLMRETSGSELSVTKQHRRSCAPRVETACSAWPSPVTQRT